MLKKRSKTKFQSSIWEIEGVKELSSNKGLQQIGFKYNPFSRDDREARMEKSREKIGSKEGEAVKIRFSKVFAFRKRIQVGTNQIESILPGKPKTAQVTFTGKNVS